jgi:tetratricopeptide (TPR) repeat protein
MTSPDHPPTGSGREPESGARGGIRAAETALTLDQVRRLLPPVEALRPLLDRIVQLAEPDGARRWAASAEVDSLANRRVSPDRVVEELPELLETVRLEQERGFRAAVDVLRRAGRGDLEGATGLLTIEAERCVLEGRLPDAEAFLEAALELAERFRDRRAALPLHLAAARVARARGRLDAAEDHYLLVLRLAEAGDDPDAALTAAVGLGNLEVDRGRWRAAEDGYARAAELLGGLDGPRPEVWHLALNRSILAREEGDLPRAWELLLEADAASRELGDGSALPIVENARGQVLLAMEEPAPAEAAFRRALAAATHPDARVTIGVNLADALLARGRLLAAGEEARRAEEVAVQSGIIARLPEVYRVLGEILAATGNHESFLLFERALDIVRDRQLPAVERARVLEAYARVEVARENHRGAEALSAEASLIRSALRERSEP